ncbi:hypothetical protein B0A50_08067 [Salinomyces thailandicus]|uniref:Uncharacterized protein n=1 Tax=Salinomyces thailandicus TaxID=706561 RepID=A0A4U0TL45_9PEZI|nr:hypothetical protein B0A50_08067 [Salinomyces thailandica]
MTTTTTTTTTTTPFQPLSRDRHALPPTILACNQHQHQHQHQHRPSTSGDSGSSGSPHVLPNQPSASYYKTLCGPPRASADEALFGREQQERCSEYEVSISSRSMGVGEVEGEVWVEEVEDLEDLEDMGRGEGFGRGREGERQGFPPLRRMAGGGGGGCRGRAEAQFVEQVETTGGSLTMSRALFRDTELGEVVTVREVRGSEERLAMADDGVGDGGGRSEHGRFARRLSSFGARLCNSSRRLKRRFSRFGSSSGGETKPSPPRTRIDSCYQAGGQQAQAFEDSQSGVVGGSGRRRGTRVSASANEGLLRRCCSASTTSSRSSRQSPLLLPETMPSTPGYERDDGGPLEPCHTVVTHHRSGSSGQEEEEPGPETDFNSVNSTSILLPCHEQATPAPAPKTHPTSTTTNPNPNLTPVPLRPRLSERQDPLSRTQYSQLVALRIFQALQNGAFDLEGIERGFRGACGNLTTDAERVRASESLIGQCESRRRVVEGAFREGEGVRKAADGAGRRGRRFSVAELFLRGR